MSTTELEKLFGQISCAQPTIDDMDNLTNHPDHDRVVQFLIGKIRSFLDDVASSDKWDGDFEYAVSHSCRILGRLNAAEACPHMLELMEHVKDDHMSEMRDAILFAMENMGPPALEPIYQKYLADQDDPESLSTWLWMLAGLGVNDPRINEALNDYLEIAPDEAVIMMGEYGDPEFLPIVDEFLKQIAGYFNEHRINPMEVIRLALPLARSYVNTRESLVVLKYGMQPDHPDFDKKVADLDDRLLKYPDLSDPD